MEILDSIRFGNIGIVKGRGSVGEVKFYIGECNGVSQEEDEKTISSVGKKFILPDGFYTN